MCHNPNFNLQNPCVFNFAPHVYLNSFGRGFKSLWMVLGLGAKGPRILRGLLCSIKTFCPPFFFHPPTNIISSDFPHISRPTHSIIPLARLPRWVEGDLWGAAGFVKCRLPSGGVTAPFVFQRASPWREKQACWSQRIDASKTLCLPSEEAEQRH